MGETPPKPTAGPRGRASTDEPRWLDAAQQRAWLNLAGVVIRLPGALDAEMQQKASLSLFEYLVLAGLSEAPDQTVRMSELARLTNSSLSRLSHVVSRLERHGWVHRRACPQDGRYTNATLTEQGFAKVVATAPGHVATVRSLVIDALTATQLRQLNSIAGRILDRIDANGDCANPPGTGHGR
jgi:DNA-binding MarR family transcriptional regulator